MMADMSHKRRIRLLALMLLPCIAVLAVCVWAVVDWKVVSFTPACKKYSNPPTHWLIGFKQLAFREGEPTEEFWQEAVAIAPDYLDWTVVDRETIAIVDGRILTTLSARHSYFAGMKKNELEREEWFHFISRKAAIVIFERRRAEGRFDGIDMAPYKVSYPYLAKNLIPDQCGFMEELIMKGGRFASE